MEFVLYLDESGDHTIAYEGRERPDPPEVFLLCGCLFGADQIAGVEAAMANLKRQHFPRGDIALVSRRIRKQEKAFTFLSDPHKREPFLADITTLISESPYTCFAAAIDKYRHWERYRNRAASPYDLSLAFILERVLMHVTTVGGGRVGLVAEARGRREDAALRLELDRLLSAGTDFAAPYRLRSCFLTPPEFKRKLDCVTGLEIADLSAYPLSQRLRYPDSRNKAFEVVRTKLHRAQRGIWGAGLKVFPDARAADYGI